MYWIFWSSSTVLSRPLMLVLLWSLDLEIPVLPCSSRWTPFAVFKVTKRPKKKSSKNDLMALESTEEKRNKPRCWAFRVIWGSAACFTLTALPELHELIGRAFRIHVLPAVLRAHHFRPDHFIGCRACSSLSVTSYRHLLRRKNHFHSSIGRLGGSI